MNNDNKESNGQNIQFEITDASAEDTDTIVIPKASNDFRENEANSNHIQQPESNNNFAFGQNRYNDSNITKNQNPALGQRKLNNYSDNPLKDNDMNKNRNNNNAPIKKDPNNQNSNSLPKKDGLSNKQKGENSAANPKKQNPLPGGSTNKKTATSDKTDAEKNSIKPKDSDKKGFNPKKNLQDYTPRNMMRNAASKLGLGKKRETEENGEESAAEDLQEGLKRLLLLIPLPVTIGIVVTAGSLLIAGFAIVSVLGGITGTIMGGTNSCDKTTYTANSADSMGFLCNMSSPYGPDAEGSEYYVTSTSGKRIPPTAGASNFHQGTDVVGVKGKNLFYLYAVADGKIEEAGPNGGFGNEVLINHNNAFYTRYGHMASIDSNIKVGTEVKAGTKLGVMGSTGISTGVHLHFELLDKDKKYVSANPFFGYSDQGYDDCLKPNSLIANAKCDFSYTGDARYMGQSGFAQACGHTSNFSNNGNNNKCCTNSGSVVGEPFTELLVNYINKFEGSGKQCERSTGGNGYLAENIGDGAVTAGHGITNADIRSAESQKLIIDSGLKNQFTYIGGKYVMIVGGCYSKNLLDQIEVNSIKKAYGEPVLKSAEKNGVTLQSYEVDALTSFNYNLGPGYIDKLVLGFKTGGYQGLWSAMKDYIHVGTQVWPGLQKRRKAEFALFVTGDYTDKGLFYSRTIRDYDNFDSENVIARKATGSASSCDVSSSSSNSVVEIAIRELTEWNKSSEREHYCTLITKYMTACGLGRVADYCAGFATYALKEAKMDTKIGLPSYTCLVSDFKNTTNGTIHKANSNYIPKPGDLIIYRDWAHIEIVEKVEGQTVHTIGGNTMGPNGMSGYCGEGTIKRKTKDLSASDITAYISY